MQGDPRAFTVLFRRFYSPVFSLCLRVIGNEAESHDVTQKTFIKAFGPSSGLDPDRPLSGWLFKIAVNLAIDETRRRRPEPLPPDVETSSSAPIETKDLERVRAAILRLPPSYRAIVALHLQQDWDYHEIAGALGITPNLARVRLFRALEMLRKELR